MAADPVAVERRPAMAAGSVKNLVDRLSKDLAKTSIAPGAAAREGGREALNGGKTRAKVRYSYTPKHEDELELRVAEVVEVVGEGEEGWLKGRLPSGQVGLFPSNFCDFSAPDEASTPLNSSAEDALAEPSGEIQPKKVRGVGFGVDILSGVKLRPASQRFPGEEREEPAKQARSQRVSAGSSPASAPLAHESHASSAPREETARVTFAYKACNEDELDLKEGDIIKIINKDSEDPGWWYGELRGRRGVFPDNFVSLLTQDVQGPPAKAPVATHVPPAVPTKPKPTTKTPPLLPAKAPHSAPAASSTAAATTGQSFTAKRDNINSFLSKPRPPSTPTETPASPASAGDEAAAAAAAAALSHPNLSRPKQQKKRPPSKVFLSEMSGKSPPAAVPSPPSQPQPPFPPNARHHSPARDAQRDSGRDVAAAKETEREALAALRTELEALKRDTDGRLRELDARLRALEH